VAANQHQEPRKAHLQRGNQMSKSNIRAWLDNKRACESQGKPNGTSALGIPSCGDHGSTPYKSFGEWVKTRDQNLSEGPGFVVGALGHTPFDKGAFDARDGKPVKPPWFSGRSEYKKGHAWGSKERQEKEKPKDEKST